MAGGISVVAALALGVVLPKTNSAYSHATSNPSNSFASAATYATPLASDDFTGTTGAAWSSIWSTGVSGTGVVNIDTNRGRLTTANTGTYSTGAKAYLTSISTRKDFDVTVDVTFSSASTSQYALIYARSADAAASAEPANAYILGVDPYAQVMFFEKNVASNNSQSVGTDQAVSVATGTPYRVRFRIVGNSLKAKIWNPVGAEPSTWPLVATDSSLSAINGSVGLRPRTGNVAGARTVYYDNFVLYDPATFPE